MSDWQLDRLPGDVRQEAENAAQRDSLPLHRWLGKLIRETCADEGVAPGRELTRAAAAETGEKGGENGPANAPRYPNAMPPRAAAEPSRPTPTARAAEPQRPPMERPQAATTPSNSTPSNIAARAATKREGPGVAAIFALPDEFRREPSRVAPVTRETAPRETVAGEAVPPAPPPSAPPAPPAAPPPAARLSTLSTAPLSTAPIAPASPPPRPTPSRLSTEPRPLPPRPEPAEPAPPPVAKAVPPTVASPATRLDDRMTALSTLVLSLRRNELSPVGEARLFLKLMTEHMASIADITIATGRTKEQVARSLRLLGLSDRLRDLIDRGALSREQAFALLDTDDPNATDPVVPHTSGSRTP